LKQYRLSLYLAISTLLHILIITVKPHRLEAGLFPSPGSQAITVYLAKSLKKLNGSIDFAPSKTSASEIPQNEVARETTKDVNKGQESATQETTGYHDRSELTVPAKPLIHGELPTPSIASQGRAKLILLISADGTVDSVISGESTLPSDYQLELATFFSKVKFEPGMINEAPVKSRFAIEITTSYEPEVLESKIINEQIQP